MSLEALAQALRADDGKLYLEEELHIFSVIIDREPRFQKFTRHEWLLLKELLVDYPREASHVNLYSSAVNCSRDESQARLSNAQTRCTLEQELRPVRALIQRLRRKLRPLHLTIDSVRDRGYSLSSMIEE